jgi:hypothetical protein
MAKEAKKPQKQVLKTLELTTLLVALDHLEEYGPGMAVPDPYEKPEECVYLKFIGEEHLKALINRLPYVRVKFNLPGSGSVIRHVFSRAAVMHLMEFSFPNTDAYRPFVRDLKSVDEKYWRVVDAEGNSVKRPKKGAGKGGSRNGAGGPS